MKKWKDMTTDEKLEQLFVDLKRTMDAINAINDRQNAVGATLADLSRRLTTLEGRASS